MRVGGARTSGGGSHEAAGVAVDGEDTQMHLI